MSEATITRSAPRGMITLRADLAQPEVVQAIKKALEMPVPETGGMIDGPAGRLAWMSPDEGLLITDPDRTEEMVARLRAGLSGLHSLVVDVSDARAMFSISGAGWRAVLAKGTPANLREVAPNTCRRTRLGQVACAFWRTDAGADLVVFRSVADFVEAWLEHAARPGSLPQQPGG